VQGEARITFASQNTKSRAPSFSLTHCKPPRCLFFLLSAALVFFAGCKKSASGLRPADIHAINREFAAAAAKVLPANPEIRIQSLASSESPENADRVDITLRGAESKESQRSSTARLLQSLASVATKHGLTQDSPAESQDGILLTYRRAGVVTHTIQVHFALPGQGGAASPSAASGAKLSIILDDFGNDRGAADAAFSLPFPVTISVLPDHPHSAEIAEEAHRRGLTVMLHLPMQSIGNEKPEKEELHAGMTAAEVSAALNEMLQGVPNAAGVNNHQGSRATADAALMSNLMPDLRNHGLFYIDSRTTAATVAFGAAQQAGVPSAFRNVPFLDDVDEVAAIRKQLDIALRGAKEKGEAVAIGHPHPATLEALRGFKPRADTQGVQLVPVSELVH